jgi:hypothetical protein
MPTTHVDRTDPQYKAYYEQARAKYAKMPTHQLLNSWDAEDLIHELQAQKALDERRLSPALQRNAALKARQEYTNLLSGGSNEEVAKVHAQVAAHEGYELPTKPDGTVDRPAALKNILLATQAKEEREHARAMSLSATEHTTTTVLPSGQKTITGQMMTKEGRAVGPVRTVESAAPNAPKAIDELVQQKDKKNHERGLDTALGALRVARNVLSNPTPSNAEDGLLIDSFLKAANPSAVIRPSMIDFVQKQTPFAEQLKKKLDNFMTLPNRDQLPAGAILTENDRRQMAQAFQQYNQAVSEDSRDHYKFIQKRAEKQNIGNDLDEVLTDEEMNVLNGKNFVQLPNRDAVTKRPGAAAVPPAPAVLTAATPSATPAATAPAAPAAAAPAAGTGASLVKQIPVVNSPAEAPDDAEFYMSPDGRKFVNRKYKGNQPAAPAPAAEPAPAPSEADIPVLPVEAR